MAKDPVPALEALLQEKLDPRVVSAWITAYLGKRPGREKRLALQTLRMEFESRQSAAPRTAGLVLRVIDNLLTELKG
jgi:hypothetical protein